MWNDPPETEAQAIRDHEVNPEYEVHLGQPDVHGRRRASIWLQGQRWTGWLEPAAD
ncbi:hypothetical protein I5G61_gp77 [Mycobacterium phage Quesadilla]|uniref:Uncharacterized protein n=1 Tax=Mycobacterium phage Quesadilla TaxID=2664226 RepID=A0A5Q2WFM6_9CAUD|nr:hypothetical protein I5G61_gp77 [Mycobacterium phage Quesadilla]QGH75325.1 hypothetical protein SEA_QUESADILLA_77 [Mycobacterium phage Quesadilla]